MSNAAMSYSEEELWSIISDVLIKQSEDLAAGIGWIDGKMENPIKVAAMKKELFERISELTCKKAEH